MIRVLIIAKKERAFKGSNGEMIPYFWYTAERGSGDGKIRFQFGSKDGEHEEGQEYELDIYREEGMKGIVWKEYVL